ncbi:AraC family transcriptional regulator [Stieleria sp. TO1_6]|uniref:helix-turn-helix transcriptional regulator n=1 Tax=Stieleria tagensis TaxID=2956795 RepID=UPI00209B9AAD|nr:AraC family transcriptional regulator [Stieleria tagensis]MCO8122463.1 AraC family transcriptional regulator [Stieleria tagensis]
MSDSKPSTPLPAFVSHQVSEAQRFFLNLNPDSNSRLEVVCGGVERMRPDYVVEREDFPFFALELVAEGRGTLIIHGQQHALSAGSVFAYGPGTVHLIRNNADDPMRKYYLDFVGTCGSKLLRESGLINAAGDYQPLSVGALHQLTDLFDMMMRESVEDGAVVHSICEALAEVTLLKIKQLALPPQSDLPQSYATYQRIRRHIEQHYLQLHSIAEVAEQCDVTAVYLSRLFNRFGDCGAYQFLLRRKMNDAAGLLMNEGLLVKDVAKRLKFADAFQFSRAFKRVYGIPPKQLRSHGS